MSANDLIHQFEQLLNQKQVVEQVTAAGLPLIERQLETARARKSKAFPPFIRVGRSVRYDPVMVQSWINQQLAQLE